MPVNVDPQSLRSTLARHTRLGADDDMPGPIGVSASPFLVWEVPFIGNVVLSLQGATQDALPVYSTDEGSFMLRKESPQ